MFVPLTDNFHLAAATQGFLLELCCIGSYVYVFVKILRRLLREKGIVSALDLHHDEFPVSITLLDQAHASDTPISTTGLLVFDFLVIPAGNEPVRSPHLACGSERRKIVASSRKNVHHSCSRESISFLLREGVSSIYPSQKGATVGWQLYAALHDPILHALVSHEYYRVI